MTISSFEELLQAARAQPEPQRLLFVFAAAELPDDSSADERRRFQAGEGGALAPRMCVDKAPAELRNFEALLEEARAFGDDWVVVFAAALAGRGGIEPSSADAEKPLERMIEAIRIGAHGSYIPFDRSGQVLLLSR